MAGVTWFERIKACETPEEMKRLLDEEGRSFCPYPDCPDGFRDGDSCGGCVLRWLEEEAPCGEN